VSLTNDDRSRGGVRGHDIALARHGGLAMTRAARQAFLDGFVQEVDPDGTLDEADRAQRAEALLRAHMRELSQRAAKARKARRHAQEAAVARVAHAAGELP
jgi:hypothetical protein